MKVRSAGFDAFELREFARLYGKPLALIVNNDLSEC